MKQLVYRFLMALSGLYKVLMMPLIWCVFRFGFLQIQIGAMKWIQPKNKFWRITFAAINIPNEALENLAQRLN